MLDGYISMNSSQDPIHNIYDDYNECFVYLYCISRVGEASLTLYCEGLFDIKPFFLKGQIVSAEWVYVSDIRLLVTFLLEVLVT